MAEFKEVMKQRKRMCDSFGTHCMGCLLYKASEYIYVKYIWLNIQKKQKKSL